MRENVYLHFNITDIEAIRTLAGFTETWEYDRTEQGSCKEYEWGMIMNKQYKFRFLADIKLGKNALE